MEFDSNDGKTIYTKNSDGKDYLVTVKGEAVYCIEVIRYDCHYPEDNMLIREARMPDGCVIYDSHDRPCTFRDTRRFTLSKLVNGTLEEIWSNEV